MEINIDLTEKMTISDIELGIVKENPALIDLQITPSKEEQIFNHDGEYGYDIVKVAPVTAEADTNIKAENIKEGVNILGVTGTMLSSDDLLKQVINGTIETITIPEGITSLRNYCFYCWSNLKTITNLSQLTSIGNNACYSTGLTSVEINKPKFTSIGDNAFYRCNSLENVNITIDNSNATLLGDMPKLSIGAYAFYNCTALKKVNINYKQYNENYNVGVDFKGTYTFYNCTALEFCRIVRPNTSIARTNGGFMFQGCTNLKTVRFDNPSNVFEISFGTSFATYYPFKNLTQEITIYIDKPRATVESWDGYTDKWGATNATIICNDDAEWVEYEE